MLSYGGLRPSEVVHLTIPDPAEQAPLVARSVTPPSPSGRGGTTLLRQRAPRSCTVFVMTPPDEHTSEGGRDDRGVPYHAESALSSAQVLKLFRQTKRKTEGPQHFAFPEISRENRGCLVLHSGNSRVSLSLRAGLGQNLRQN